MSCPFCAKDISPFALVCLHCNRDLTAVARLSAGSLAPSTAHTVGSKAAVVAALFIVIASAGLTRFVSAPPVALSELTDSHRAAVAQVLAGRALDVPVNLRVAADHSVVADYVLGALGETLDADALRRFGEARLHAMRQALLPFGFRVYEVNVRGAAGTTTARWNGIARTTDPGPPGWDSP